VKANTKGARAEKFFFRTCTNAMVTTWPSITSICPFLRANSYLFLAQAAPVRPLH